MPKSNSLIRKKITDEAKLKGWPSLHKHLAVLDPESASRIHPNDAQRIQRALEVYEISNKTMSLLQKENKTEEILSKYKVFQFAIKPESKEQLRENVKERFLKMLDDGLVKEFLDFGNQTHWVYRTPVSARTGRDQNETVHTGFGRFFRMSLFNDIMKDQTTITVNGIYHLTYGAEGGNNQWNLMFDA